MSIPHPEYRRPQWVREAWLNLNGLWKFEIDAGCSGRARGLATVDHLANHILVPFCLESRLSGIGHVDFMPTVWFRRFVILPEAWEGKRVLLHFGAVDYQTEVWVNGQSAGTHRGGYCSFTLDITSLLQSGENIIMVCAEDDTLVFNQQVCAVTKERDCFGMEMDGARSADITHLSRRQGGLRHALPVVA